MKNKIPRTNSSSSIFARRVHAVVAGIPRGKVMTYGHVAARSGNPKAARAVGAILSKNYDRRIPCHRVVRADGSLGGYNRGVMRKEKILRREKAI